MNALFLALIAAWMWAILVFANRAHMRAILILWWLVPLLACISGIALIVDAARFVVSWVIDVLDDFDDAVFGSEKKGKLKCQSKNA
jgi:hypothetical protein